MRFGLFAFVFGSALTAATQLMALEYKTVPGAGGVPLNTVEAGDKTKPGILLIHGFAQTHWSFKAQLESADLTRDFHVVAFDLRGHGNSGKPWKPEDYRDSKAWADDVAAVMDATGLQKPVIVGWSFGGFVLANYIEHYGTARVAGVNLVGSAGGLVTPLFPPPANPDAVKQMTATRELQLSGNIEKNIAGAANGITFLTAKPGDAQWQELSRASGLLLQPYVRTALSGRNLDNTKVLPMIKVPTLITYGTKDEVVNTAQIEALKKGIKGAKVSAYKDIGHSPFYEAADQFNKELADFARKATR